MNYKTYKQLMVKRAKEEPTQPQTTAAAPAKTEPFKSMAAQAGVKDNAYSQDWMTNALGVGTGGALALSIAHALGAGKMSRWWYGLLGAALAGLGTAGWQDWRNYASYADKAKQQATIGGWLGDLWGRTQAQFASSSSGKGNGTAPGPEQGSGNTNNTQQTNTPT